MRTIKLTLAVVLGALLAILVLQNTAPVRAQFLWYSAEMPVIVLLVATAATGFALGLIAALTLRRATRARPVPR